jgi:hypothetical protein
MEAEDDLLLSGVPDDAPAEGMTDAELLELEAEAELAAAPEPPAPDVPTDASPPSPVEAEPMEPTEPAAEAAAVRKSGKRRVIEHGWTSDPAAAIDPLAPDELARRAARAAKFGVPAPAPPVVPSVLISREEVLAREARAAKFGVAAPFSPLDAIASAAGGVGKGLWEKRRDAAPEEAPRPEGVYIYGTDRLSTEELLLLFASAGVGGASPHHAEWVDDSSAVVVFCTGGDAHEALLSHTDPLLSHGGGEAGTDHLTWRTTPPGRAAAGKGLQLLFRRATESDVKPARRNASRWYGEANNKKEARNKRGGRGEAGGGGVSGGGISKSGRGGPARTLAAALGAANKSGPPGLAAALASGGAVLKRGEPDLRRRLREGVGEAGPVGRGVRAAEEEMEE